MDDPDFDAQAITGNQEPPSGTNGLLPSCFWAHGSQRALRTLGGAALRQSTGAIPSVLLSLVPQECREVIQSAVECALPQGQVLSDPVTGAQYTGWWGLAPSWRDGALNLDGRREVTACMLQKLNGHGIKVPILLEGPNPAIAKNQAYDAAFPIQESTMFGDLFSSTIPLLDGLPAFNAFVCWESALPQSCGLLGLPLLGQRMCDDLLLCGITPVGPCSLACAQNGDYWKCRPTPLSPWWTQTVRVSLATETCE